MYSQCNAKCEGPLRIQNVPIFFKAQQLLESTDIIVVPRTRTNYNVTNLAEPYTDKTQTYCFFPLRQSLISTRLELSCDVYENDGQCFYHLFSKQSSSTSKNTMYSQSSESAADAS